MKRSGKEGNHKLVLSDGGNEEVITARGQCVTGWMKVSFTSCAEASLCRALEVRKICAEKLGLDVETTGNHF